MHSLADRVENALKLYAKGFLEDLPSYKAAIKQQLSWSYLKASLDQFHAEIPIFDKNKCDFPQIIVDNYYFSR